MVGVFANAAIPEEDVVASSFVQFKLCRRRWWIMVVPLPVFSAQDAT